MEWEIDYGGAGIDPQDNAFHGSDVGIISAEVGGESDEGFRGNWDWGD